MKGVLLICLFLFIQLLNNAQNTDKNSQLNISIGPSFPIGQFANKNIYSDKAGLAGTGAGLDISYLVLAKNKIGLAISLHGQIDPVTRHSMEEAFSKAQFSFYLSGSSSFPPPQQTSPQPTTTYSNWNFKSASWKLGSLMIGGYSEFKTSRSKLSVTSKAMIGLIYAVPPKIDGSSITDTSIIHITQSSKSAFGFAYLVSGGLKIRINNKLNFISCIEFFGTNNITFKNIVAEVILIKYPNEPGRSSFTQRKSTANGIQTINAINLFTGIVLKL